MNIKGFMPYCYLPTPRGFGEDDIDPFISYLNVSLYSLLIGKITDIHQNILGGESVVSVEIVKRRSLWGYSGDDWVLFLKVTVSTPKTVPKIRDKSCYR